MPADFPASITSLTRVQPGDYQNAPGTEADLLHNAICDEIEAIEGRIGVTGSAVPGTVEERLATVQSDTAAAIAGLATHQHVPGDVTGFTAAVQAAAPAETASTIGALVAGATEKASPVDADSMGLSDSAAGNTLKKWTWANIKLALNGLFAKLSGVSGGQKLIGGTAAADNLSLQATSASGTTGTVKALRVLTGDAGVTEALTVLNNGNVGVGKTDPAYLLQIAQSSSISVSSGGSIGINVPPTASGILGASTLNSDYRTGSYTLPTKTSGNDCQAAFRSSANPAANSSCIFRAVYGYVESNSACTYNVTNLRGIQFEARQRGSGGFGNVRGVYGLAGTDSTGSTSAIYAFYGEAGSTSSGAVTRQYGQLNYVYNSGSATVSAGYGIGVQMTQSGASATITSNVGIDLGGADHPWSNAGTITNNTCIFVGASTDIGTNKKVIHSDNPSRSYLAGALSIGDDSLTAKLSVMSTTEQLRLLYDATKYASLTVNSASELKISAPLIWRPAASATPPSNGDLSVEISSNTTGAIKFRGTDGTVRSFSFTLT